MESESSRRWTVRAAVVLAAVLLTVVGVRLVEPLVLYQPPSGEPTPVEARVGQDMAHTVDVAEVELTSTDGLELPAWWVTPAGVDAPEEGWPTVVWLHGNASDRSLFAGAAVEAATVGVASLLVNHRGFADADGSPSPEGFVADTVGALQWVDERPEAALRPVLAGFSLGGATAAMAAAEVEDLVGALVLVAPVSTTGDVLAQSLPGLGRPLGWLLTHRFESVDSVGELVVSTSVIVGGDDDVTPPAMAEDVFDAAGCPGELVVVPGVGHVVGPLVDDGRLLDLVTDPPEPCD
ncbi:MAG: alpha/beta hydrolase [Acidimicrobiia bacterium]|nr:alpha/beta hydrolase [Acidimicrobiia bacterium]